MDPVTAGILAAIGITLGLANFINGTVRGEMAKHAAQEILTEIQSLGKDIREYMTWARRELENILAGQKVIEDGLREILAAVNWNAIVTEIAEPVLRVQFLFEEMVGFASKGDDERKSWIDAALSEDVGGLRFSLSAIHDCIMGVSVLSTRPLLEVFKEKVEAQPGLKTSVRFLVLAYLRTLVELQAHGYASLLNALVYNGSVDEQDQVIALMKSRFQSQQANFIEVVKNSANAYAVDAMNDNWARADSDAIFVPGQVELPPGTCVVGVKFQWDTYEIHGESVNTIADGTFPFIGVAPIEALIFGDVPQITWLRCPNAATSADFHLASMGDVNHVDLTEMATPPDRIATGLGLRVVDGNRFSLSIRPGDVTDAGIVPGDWISNDKADDLSGPMSEAQSPVGRFFVDTNEVVPSPVWPISGFALYPKNNRIAMKVYPSSPGFQVSLFRMWSDQKFQIRVDGSWNSISVTPEKFRIPLGAVVSWFNNGAGSLYVSDGERTTEQIPNGSSASLKFDMPGEIQYTCTSDYIWTAKGTLIVV